MNKIAAEYKALTGRRTPEVDLLNEVDVLPSRLAATELAVGSVAAAAASATALSHARGGPSAAARVDGSRVSAAFRSDRLFRLNGQQIEGFAALSGFWPTADGWVRTHANYPHHRHRLLTALGLRETAGPAELTATLAGRGAQEVETSVSDAGGVCVAVRSPSRWREHPQDAAVRRLPLVSWTRLDDAPARKLPPPPTAPLLPAAGLRVLDLTRVIAGPVATRTLALLGADVLRLDSPQLPEIPAQHLDTGMGKRSALIDLALERAVFEMLLADADVVVVGYRPHALDRHGLAPQHLVQVRPGLVVASLSAWGGVGPWGGRRGFDSIVQAATGIAAVESLDGRVPGALAAQVLDHATGYLLAAGILTAITDQLERGGSRHVQAHLAKTAAWLLDHRDDKSRTLPDVNGLLHERSTPSGVLRYVPPAFDLDGGPTDWLTVGSPWGADPPRWRA